MHFSRLAIPERPAPTPARVLFDEAAAERAKAADALAERLSAATERARVAEGLASDHQDKIKLLEPEVARLQASLSDLQGQQKSLQDIASGQTAAVEALTRDVKKAKSMAARLRMVASRWCYCASLGLLGWLVAAALCWFLFAFGQSAASGAVRWARAACAVQPAPLLHGLACVSDVGCLELLGTPSTWVCAPPEWLADPIPAPVPLPPAPEFGVWYSTSSELAVACRSGCGTAARGT